MEEHFINGGLGSAAAEIIAETGRGRLLRLGLKDKFVTEVAPYPEVLSIVGLDAGSISRAVISMIGNGNLN